MCPKLDSTEFVISDRKLTKMSSFKRYIQIKFVCQNLNCNAVNCYHIDSHVLLIRIWIVSAEVIIVDVSMSVSEEFLF